MIRRRLLALSILAMLALGVFAPEAGAQAPADSLAPDSLARDSIRVESRDYLAEMRANFTPQNRVYSSLRVALSFLGPVYAMLAGVLILFSGLSAFLRDVAHSMGRTRWVRVLIYLVLYAAVMFVVTFPIEWFGGFVLEHRFGLSNQSFLSWVGDQTKGLMLTIFFFGVVPILWLFYSVIARSPRRWWLWLGLAALPLIVATVLIEPLVVDPVFNKFTRLSDRRLEARILDLAARAGIPGRNVYEVNKSAQTKKYNAYVNGFGVSQRIVLWDTTLQGMAEDEILFIMGHEMGHYRLHHIWKGIAYTWLLILALAWITAGIAQWATARFGARWGFTRLDDVASLPLLAVILSLCAFLTQPLSNAYSRTVETEADVYGLEITRDNDAAARAFLKLGSQNKSDPEPSPFVRAVLYSHPTLVERVTLALGYRPWAEGKPNRAYRGQ